MVASRFPYPLSRQSLSVLAVGQQRLSPLRRSSAC